MLRARGPAWGVVIAAYSSHTGVILYYCWLVLIGGAVGVGLRLGFRVGVEVGFARGCGSTTLASILIGRGTIERRGDTRPFYRQSRTDYEI